LSWLAFNERVLAEAGNTNHPLLERLRFLAISASNLDEFFMVRVAGLKHLVTRGSKLDYYNSFVSPQRQLKEIDNRIRHLLEQQQVILPGLLENLSGHGVTIVSPDQLDDADKAHVKTFIFNEVMQIITPQTLDPAHPFPFIANEGLGMFLDLKEAKNRHKTALIMLSPVIRRFCRLPGEDDRFITLEDAILLNLDEIFPHHELMDHVLFRVLRDSEIEYDEEAEDLVTTFENALRARRRGNVIALQLSADQSSPLIDVLADELKVLEEDRFYVGGMIDLSDLSQICNAGNDQLRFPSYSARFPERIRDFGGDCFAAIRAKDILVHHPYESFDVVLQFLRQAAEDPKVVSIRQTLYRTQPDSPIVRALISAAEQGKSVTALVEIKARFDEEVNIRLARDLERAGVQVVYGFVDLKTHAKLSLVVRQEENGLRSYAHCGTGNYHPSKAKIYTDLSFFTCDSDICYDIVRIFNYMTSYVKPLKLNKMIFAPVTARDHFVASVEAEIEAAKAGRPSGIWIKVNSLVDRQSMELLYKASQAGVPIELIVRGICCLRPGVEGLSEHIKVRSLIGRFLEHARIYVFANGVGLPSPRAKVYIAS
ncbi:MAG: polyphosphate kinase 1, partial [Candidatus Puniceispirillales bacterium]